MPRRVAAPSGLAAADPALAAAILAHELGHVQQKDGYFWGYADLSGSLLLRSLATLLIVVTIERMAIVASRPGFLHSAYQVTSVLIPAAVCARLFWAHSRLLNARRNSELLADGYAAALTGPEPLARAIDSYSIDGSYEHPDRATRLAQLRQERNEERSLQM